MKVLLCKHYSFFGHGQIRSRFIFCEKKIISVAIRPIMKKGSVFFLFFVFGFVSFEIVARPLTNRRTFRRPTLMEIVARKMGIIDFFSNLVNGFRSIFIKHG